jgi:hypothetical protein
MGGGAKASVRKGRAEKLYTQHGIVTNPGIKGKSGKPLNAEAKGKQARFKDVEEKPAFTQRVGKKGDKHYGMLHVNPSRKQDIKQRSYNRLVTFNQTNGLPKPAKAYSRNPGLDVFNYVLTEVSARATRRKLKSTHIMEFVAHFMADGFQFLDVSKIFEDAGKEGDLRDFLRNFITGFVNDFYVRKTTTREELRTLINTLDRSDKFWRNYSKKYGYFMVPNGRRLIGGNVVTVHHLPLKEIANAGKCFLLARNHRYIKDAVRLDLTVGDEPENLKRASKTTIRGGGNLFCCMIETANEIHDVVEIAENYILPTPRITYKVEKTEEKPKIRGAGGGKKMVSSKVKNKGSGGKSKVQRDPDTKLDGEQKKQAIKKSKQLGEGLSDEDGEENDEEKSNKKEFKKIAQQFMCGERLGHDGLFSHEEITAILEERVRVYLESVQPDWCEVAAGGRGWFGHRRALSVKSFDQHGAPFCGLAAIDLASGNKPNVNKYVDFCARIAPEEIIGTVGVPGFMKNYANSRHVNLVILSEGQVYIGPRVFEKTVVLRHADEHYTVLVKRAAVANNMNVRGNFERVTRGWLTASKIRMEASEPVVEANSEDRRGYAERRDPKRFDTARQNVTFTQDFYLNFYFFLVLLPFMRIISRFTVDSIRFHSKFKEIQHAASLGESVEDCLLSVHQGRELNDTTDPTAVYNTTEALRLAYKLFPRKPSRYDKLDYFAVNAPNQAAIIPNLEIILQNQEEGIEGGGVNHFVRPSKDRPLTTKVEKPVATAPGGVVMNGTRVVTPGLISLTDPLGLVVGAGGRGQSKESAPMDFDFMRVSDELVDRLCDGTDVSSVRNKPRFQAYRHVYKGKKSARVILADIRRYKKYLDGKMSVREEEKFKTHGMFLKLESNIKLLEELLFVRPRTIMTMSDKMLMDLCIVCDLIHAAYRGPMAEYQVKNMDIVQMARKVVSLQDQDHVVTDYSAFESSIRAWMRKLEMRFIKKLARRCGMDYLVREIEELGIDSGRVLKHGTVKWFVESRCSGDFWTSFGNGLVAICLMHYCWVRSKTNLEFKMVAEGDDGLISSEVPDVDLLLKLGLKFSTEIRGTLPGDTDFLSARWVEAGGTYHRLTNIGKAFNVFWIRGGHGLRRSKQLYLLRIKALSLWYSSPGSPIVTEICQRIEKLTRGKMKFKGAERYLDAWKDKDLTGSFPEMKVDERLRAFVAEGAAGFPPIPVYTQLSLGKRLLHGEDINLWSVLDDYESIRQLSDVSDPSKVNWDNRQVEELVDGLGFKAEYANLDKYQSLSVLRTYPHHP